MKRILFLLIIVSILISCSKNKELHKSIDFYVTELNTNIKHYAVLNSKDITITEDKKYQVKPIGRLINVKILKAVDNNVYVDLKNELSEHYKNDKRVNKVYINGGGTIMIDCRN